jgi:hypothetical protein
MTLKEAQKQFPDAVQMKVTFRKGKTMTSEQLSQIATSTVRPSKVLFCETTLRGGRIITSQLAYEQESNKKPSN